MLLLVSDFQSKPSKSKTTIKKKSKLCLNLDSDTKLENTQYTNEDKVPISQKKSHDGKKADETGKIHWKKYLISQVPNL